MGDFSGVSTGTGGLQQPSRDKSIIYTWATGVRFTAKMALEVPIAADAEATNVARGGREDITKQTLDKFW